jgi:NAD(P)-dependent dehydrogenase (short-subunit alcohol dehydrogenase family)
MAGSLDGRKAVVAGASSGIGEATVEALAREMLVRPRGSGDKPASSMQL